LKESEKFSESAALCLLLALIAVLYSIAPVHNGNIFWHLRNGIDIVETGEIRTADTFSWTQHGAYWIQQEWLAESAMALAWIHLGEAGPVLLKALFIGLSVFFAFKASLKNGAEPCFAFVFAAFWLALAQPRWIDRPHIFSIFFFSLYLYVLSFRHEKPWKLALILFPLQVLWVNVHAGFVMGVFLASVPAMEKLLSGRIKELPGWLLPPIILLAASGIHPNGFRSLEYLPSFLAQPLYKQSIREWWSPFDERYAPDKIISRTALLLSGLTIGTTALLVFFSKKINRGRILALLMLTAATVFAARNGELLAPAMMVWIPGMLVVTIPRRFCFALSMFLVIVPFTYGIPREVGPPRNLGAYVDWTVYPVELADILDAHPELLEKVVLFNTNEIAGYLQYRFGERLQLFIDGRCQLFPEEFYWDYLMLTESPGAGFRSLQKSLFDRYDFNMMIFNSRKPFSSVHLAAALPEWAPIHIDQLTCTYAKWELLRDAGLDSLAFRYFDPLDPSAFVTRPLYMMPSPSLHELLIQREQLHTTVLDIVIESLYFRNDTVYEADVFPGKGVWMYTLDCWKNCREGNLQAAAISAGLSRDSTLQTAVAVLQNGVLQNGGTMLGITPGMIRSGRDEKTAYITALWVTGQQVRALEEAEICMDSLSGWGVAQCALLYSLAGEQSQALELVELAVARTRGPFVFGRAAMVYQAGGNYSRAIEFCMESLEIAPMYAEARLILADCLWESCRIEEAFVAYLWFEENGFSLPQYALERVSLLNELINDQTPAGGEGL
jgi:tetratricopeptide (TPR) repeat protein